ncbi:MAG TPA: Smr/MutS family protein [Polyangiales bacterium]|nr:Smr/MutS family protein [Polyangiales bacterium]
MARKRKKPRTAVPGGADDGEDWSVPQPKAPPAIGTQLGQLLAQAGVTRVAARTASQAKARPAAKIAHVAAGGSGPRTLPPPSPEPPSRVHEPGARPDEVHEPPARPRTATELRMLNDAYAGVQPLGRKTTRLRAPVATPAAPLSGELARNAQQTSAEDAEARARLDALVGGGVRFQVRSDDAFVEGVREGVSPKLLPRLTGKGFAPEATLDLHGLRAADVAAKISSFVRTQKRAGARHLLVITGKGLHSKDGVSALRRATIDALTRGGAAPLVGAFATAHDVHGGSGAIAVLLA